MKIHTSNLSAAFTFIDPIYSKYCLIVNIHALLWWYAVLLMEGTELFSWY